MPHPHLTPNQATGRRSAYRVIFGKPYKSCPRCSRGAGRVVWRPVSWFPVRRRKDGATAPHSYCRACRARKDTP